MIEEQAHREDGSSTAPPEPKAASPIKNALTAVALLALLSTAILGSNAFGIREDVFGTARPAPRAPTASRQAKAPSAAAIPAGDGAGAPTPPAVNTVLRSQPWWQSVITLTGTGPATTEAFTVADGAVQWRVKWSCDSGRLSVVAPGRSKPVVDAACPGPGTGYSSAAGTVRLAVQADGPWQLQVDQQLDVPLDEPPLPAMSAPGAERVSSGSFYRIDQTGSGTAALYRLADGSYAIRLEDFFVTANSELEVKLSALDEPKSSQQFSDAPSALVAPLDVTAGSLNFTVPPDVDPTRYKSVVIWCRLINSAYAGATLRPVS